MNCGSCKKEILPDSVFCTWCGDFLPSSGQGRKASLFARWVALVVDPLIAVILWLLGVGVIGLISTSSGIVAAVVFPVVYLVWFLTLLRQGLTPGKKLLGLQVVDYQTGSIPGFGKMFLREIVGRFISGLFSGLGYFWAIFDKNSQAWHDKIAGTVVLKRAPGRAPAVAAHTAVAVEQLLMEAPAGVLAVPSPRFTLSGRRLVAAGSVVALFVAAAAWLGVSRGGRARVQPDTVTLTALAAGSVVPSGARATTRKSRADLGSKKPSTSSSPALLTAAPATRRRPVVVQQGKGASQSDSADHRNVPAVTSSAFRRPVTPAPAAVEPDDPDSAAAPVKSANGDRSAPIVASKEASPADAAAPVRAYQPQFEFLVGEWECMTAGNHYRMRVAWDSSSREFKGSLSRQGQTSEYVGFQLGEIIWMARPRGPAMFAEQSKWRSGANGVSSSFRWQSGPVFLQRSSVNHLVGNGQEYTRVR